MSEFLRLPLNGNGSQLLDLTMFNKLYPYLVIQNTAAYSITLYKGNSSNSIDKFGFVPIFTVRTIILPRDVQTVNLVWSGTGEDSIELFLSEENPNQNQTLVSPGGSSSVVIAADSAGLAKANQLPDALEGGNLKVVIKSDSTTGLAKDTTLTSVDNELIALNTNFGTTGSPDTELSLIGRIKKLLTLFPAALTAGGNLKTALVEELPAGTKNIGDVDVLTIPDEQIKKPPTTPTLSIVTLISANTEYPLVVPAGTKTIIIKERTNSIDCRMAYVTGKVAGSIDPYQTLNGGLIKTLEGLQISALTLYFASATAGTVLEVEFWS